MACPTVDAESDGVETVKAHRRISSGRPAVAGLVILAAGLVLPSGNALAAAADFTEYPIPTANSGVAFIAAGPDGNLWFIERGNQVAKVTTSGAFTEYPIPTASSYPWNIAAGADGNIWITEFNVDKVAKVTTSGVFTEYPTPMPNSAPQGIAAGPDGNVWFTEPGVDKVAKVTTSGIFTEYTIPTTVSDASAITAGPDGNLWFTEFNVSKVAKVTTSGAFTEYTIPTASSGPDAIVAGPDGNLWFTEEHQSKVAKVTTSGVFTEYTVPTANSVPIAIAAGPDGNIWFTEQSGNQVAKVTTFGAFTEYRVPTANSGPSGIAVGSDAKIWFTEASGNKVAKVVANTGLLRATSSPAVPTQILVDGQIADSWGLNGLEESTGTHTACFTHVQGWTEPPCQTVTVTAGATTTVTGSFTQRGELQVFTSPAVPSQITLDGNPTDDWGMFTDVPTGAHTVCYGKVANFDPPACQSITVNAGTLTATTGTFTSHPGAPGQSGLGLLRVVTSPALQSQISIQQGANKWIADSWGLNWLELAPGSYTVTFSHIEGWTEPQPQTVTVTAGSTTAVTGTFTQRGELHVFSSPAVAATIFVDAIARDDWGTFTDIPAGSHTVCFGPATGFANAPACQTVTVDPGVETDVTGNYR
jgi:streptogramin lyase